jgi:Asp-tRNA(Asn)/Glu-tRNA(Gln) amidotransferase B subunit
MKRTYNTTPEQEEILVWIAAEQSANLPEGSTPITADDVAQRAVTNMFERFSADRINSKRIRALEAIRKGKADDVLDTIIAKDNENV